MIKKLVLSMFFIVLMAMTVRYLDVIDTRSFDGSIRTFIKQTKPDVVMTCMDVPWKGEEHSWNIK